VSSSQTLANLRELQALREQRSKADHARAVRAERSASEETKKAKAKLDAQNLALDHYAAQGELQIERFQIFAQLINDSAAELETCRETYKQASDDEISKRQLRLRAERQSDHLAECHREAVGKERRKEEDRKSRDFLSRTAASRGARV
jgi:hypothetical protein